MDETCCWLARSCIANAAEWMTVVWLARSRIERYLRQRANIEIRTLYIIYSQEIISDNKKRIIWWRMVTYYRKISPVRTTRLACSRSQTKVKRDNAYVTVEAWKITATKWMSPNVPGAVYATLHKHTKLTFQNFGKHHCVVSFSESIYKSSCESWNFSCLFICLVAFHATETLDTYQSGRLRDMRMQWSVLILKW